MVTGEVRSLERVREILRATKTIAVLGASTHPERPACYVPDYLHAQGYRILPVNPAHVGERGWGEPFRAELAELDEPIDLVDVFRHPRFLAGHLPELLALAPRVVWFQQGIRDDAVAQALIAAGIEVVQDRCTLVDHRRLVV